MIEIFTQEGTALKICGVRSRADAVGLVEMGVDAVGFNFWPESKRYLNPETAHWLKDFSGKILRVGVFVNDDSELPRRLYHEGFIDVVQLHGEESPEVTERFVNLNIPVIKALGVKDETDIDQSALHRADAILLDAHAPQVFGGTGRTFDWKLATDFKMKFPKTRMVLAGGITIANAAEAVRKVSPAALDVASGAEIEPGVKDFQKVAALLAACRNT